MHGLRPKLSLGFGGLLLIILVIGIEAILNVGELGQSIDVILRENYRSVIAAQEMKDSLERVDSGVLFILSGYEPKGKAQIDQNLDKFGKAMAIERGNITLPGEGDAFQELQRHYAEYQNTLKQVTDPAQPVEARREEYFTRLLPLFGAVKDAAENILQMNQQNMSDANMAARKKATEASQWMYLLLTCGVVVAGLFVYYTGRWILRPITALTTSANEIAHGNLDLVVGTNSRDEIGQLSRAFDAMASGLREYRRTNEAKLLNMQRATQQALDSLSAPIIVVDLNGTIGVVTKAAQEMFGVEIGCYLRDCKHAWMDMLVQQVLHSGRREQFAKGDYLVQVFVNGQEKFFRPEAIPVQDGLGEIVGVTLLLYDATQSRQQDELKRGLVSTVSHQLKTPLTSIRMALYLLLDDKLGALTSKQEELLTTARDDCDRLNAIVEDLLDIARIQSGRIQVDFRDVNAGALALAAVESFKVQAQDRGISLSTSIPPALPSVRADATRVPHVFANLLANAIMYTSPGGSITVSARAEGDTVWYSVSDTGAGIPPEYQARVFEQFFRVPQEGKDSGAGLGLAIAKEIVTAHGGEIRVESWPGKGSTFSFSLKQAAAAAPEQRS